MTPDRVLQQVVDLLEAADVEYRLTGSLASSIHGHPRSTQDIDLVIEGSREQVLSLVSLFDEAGFYVSPEAAGEAFAARGRFNAIDRETGWKVDLILRKDREFSQVEFERRTREDVLELSLDVATPEDTLLAKLEWARLGESRRQIEDAAAILEVQGPSLDRIYVLRWVGELGLEEEWEAARALAAGEG